MSIVFAIINRLSLRTRLIVLGAMLALAVMTGLIVSVRLVNSSARAVFASTTAQLRSVVNGIARDYANHVLYDRSSADSSPLGDPKPDNIIALTVMTSAALQRQPGTEGGFYSAAHHAVVSYAYPTYEGTGSKTDVPQAEQPMIANLCEMAISDGQAQTRTVEGESEAIVFASTPLVEDGQTTGAAWAMQRIHNIRGDAQRANLVLMLLLALVMLVTLSFGFVTVRSLRRGVESIEAGLGKLGSDFGVRVRADGQPELERIALAINRLAQSLEENVARQRGLELELRRSEKLSALGRLVAGVAHEVRNPLGSMKLKLQLCRRAGLPTEEVQKTFSVLETEINRLDALVKRLLEIGRARELVREACDVHALLEERASMAQETASQAGIEVCVGRPDRPLAVELDRSLIAVVLDNLIANAIEAMRPDGGVLTLGCGASTNDQSGIEITVTDSGRGLSEEEMEKIWEPFYTTSEGGLGLGLVISRELVAAHGGNLRVISATKQGTVFTIELPVSVGEKPNQADWAVRRAKAEQPQFEL